MHDLKMTDQVASSHGTKSNDGHRNPGVKMQDMKMQELKLTIIFVFRVTAKFFRSNHGLTVHITELELEFKTS